MFDLTWAIEDQPTAEMLRRHLRALDADQLTEHEVAGLGALYPGWTFVATRVALGMLPEELADMTTAEQIDWAAAAATDPARGRDVARAVLGGVCDELVETIQVWNELGHPDSVQASLELLDRVSAVAA